MPQETKDAEKPSEGIISGLRDIQGEFAQLSELEDMEHNYAQKLVDSLKILLSAADHVVPLDAGSMGENFEGVREAHLAAEAVVVIKKESGESTSTGLSKFGSKDILKIVQQATPFLKKALSQKRKETGERVELLEKILKELKKTSSALKQSRQELAPAEEDLVSSSIASE